MPDSVFIKANISLENRYEKAQKYLDSAMKIAMETNDLNAQLNIQSLFSNSYEKLNRYKEAFEAYQIYIHLRDSIAGDEVKKNILRKELNFEFTKKESEYRFRQQLSDEKLKQTEKEAQLIKKDKELQHLAYLKEQAERQEKEKRLILSEMEKELQASEIKLLNKDKEIHSNELSISQSKVKQQFQQRNWSIASGILMAGLYFFMYRGYSKQKVLNHVISTEKQKSETLLLNILPAKVASELKTNGKAVAQRYDNITVLFSDFVNFTGTAEKQSPEEVVGELNECFTAFDNIMVRYELEKIKTIGDAYMAECGLHSANANHAQLSVRAALDILAFLKTRSKNESTFEIRIGINSGSVVAGIVGVKKFAYDIWGDDVNTAARMEQNSEPGKINISENTFELAKNEFDCTYCGEIEAKNKGKLKMYFIKGKGRVA